MAYLLQFHESTVVPYLLNLELSRAGRVVMNALFHNDLRAYADAYRDDPERRLATGSDCFRVDYIFRDPANRTIHHLRLILSDAAAQYGVLQVVYVEDEAVHETPPDQ